VVAASKDAEHKPINVSLNTSDTLCNTNNVGSVIGQGTAGTKLDAFLRRTQGGLPNSARQAAVV
jgi:hypothetical protein